MVLYRISQGYTSDLGENTQMLGLTDGSLRLRLYEQDRLAPLVTVGIRNFAIQRSTWLLSDGGRT